VLLAFQETVVAFGPATLNRLLYTPVDWSRLVLRCGFLLMSGFLLGYLAEREKELRAEIALTNHLLSQARVGNRLSEALIGTSAELARVFGAAPGTAIRTGLYLAQAGEFGFVLLALATGPSRMSRAADTPDPPLGHDGAATRSEAEKHFRRGIELYDDADLAGATAELERAYQIVPSYKILYNLGQISYQRQDYVQALAHFRHYLRDGGEDLPRARRDKVEEDVQQLERRIGRIEIATETTDDGADVLLDDVKVASAPLSGPLSASVGQRKLELVLADQS